MTQHQNLNEPWSLEFHRDGTEDIGTIYDAQGDPLVESRPFWLPEGDDPIPPTLSALRIMVAAPKLLDELSYYLEFAVLNDDGEDESFSRRISEARLMIAEAIGRPG